jgi:hypothetical protein
MATIKNALDIALRETTPRVVYPLTDLAGLIAATQAAQDAANSANTWLLNSLSDSVLTVSELQTIRNWWDATIAEQPLINAQVTAFTLTALGTAYTTAIGDLGYFMNGNLAWTVGTIPAYIATTYINSATLATTGLNLGATTCSAFRTLVANFGIARTAIFIAAANAAKVTADAAKAAADLAQVTANNVNSGLANILSDNNLSIAELNQIRGTWDNIISEKASILAQASTYSVSVALYNSTLMALGTFLNGSAWSSGIPQYLTTSFISGVTTAGLQINATTGADFRAVVNSFGTARTAVFQGISDAAATTSTWSGVSDTTGKKPADGATRNVARGKWLLLTEYLIGDTVTDADGYGWVCKMAHISSLILTLPVYPITENADWLLYVTKGVDAISVQITSTNGSIFKVGQAKTTRLTAKVFQGGAEITSTIQLVQFKWIRASVIDSPAPNDDATWNSLHQQGYPVIDISVDDVHSRATFFCEITSLIN